MSKLTMSTLATIMLAIPLPISAVAGKARSKADPSCVINADGQPGKDNQGASAGRGGTGGSIHLKGKLPGGCVSANGGNGGNNNRGENSGDGGNGGTIKF
jgi:hypothetical protein